MSIELLHPISCSSLITSVFLLFSLNAIECGSTNNEIQHPKSFTPNSRLHMMRVQTLWVTIEWLFFFLRYHHLFWQELQSCWLYCENETMELCQNNHRSSLLNSYEKCFWQCLSMPSLLICANWEASRSLPLFLFAIVVFNQTMNEKSHEESLHYYSPLRP